MLQNSYDLIADEWHENSIHDARVARTLSYVDRLLDGLPPRATVLDLGCGTGNPIARHIIDRGFHVVGVDQSQKMLAIAQRVIPEAELIHADMIDVQFTQQFAAAILWDSAFHVQREQHERIYRKVAGALEAGGRMLLSVGGEGAESLDSTFAGLTSEMFGATFFYDAFEPQLARQLIETAGFEIELWEVDDPSSHGHIAVIARKT
ncbi:MAG TPA: class I SAM-dependent methyltransferase [Pyrinomonadaceae bacterium]|jgi:SAM-dependent methyltransferase|nr:class I SAM-dependent methyltransferase [Pyrinomonadaceae bacterium]